MPSCPRARACAANTPFRAARPACSGFTIVPKFSLRPDASDAAIASACAAASRPARAAALAAAARADRPERRRAMPAALIVSRIHRAVRVALRLRNQRRTRRARRGPDERATSPAASDGRHEGRARVRERHEAHVVVVERVRRGAVGERRVWRRARAACARHARTCPPARAMVRGRCARPARRRRRASRRPCRAPPQAARARLRPGAGPERRIARVWRRRVTGIDVSRPALTFAIVGGANRRHESLLDDHVVERRLDRRRATLRLWPRSSTVPSRRATDPESAAASRACAPSRSVEIPIARAAPSRSAPCAVADVLTARRPVQPVVPDDQDESARP